MIWQLFDILTLETVKAKLSFKKKLHNNKNGLGKVHFY